MPPIKHRRSLFLSTVSSEFEPHRLLLAGDLKRPDLEIKVQEDFINTGGSTLEKLDDYILHCDGVIHLVGKATGEKPELPAVAALLARYPDFASKVPTIAAQLALPDPGFSYTMWEAYLAVYHGRELFVYRATDFDPIKLSPPSPDCRRSPRFVYDAAQEHAQQQHYERLCKLGKDRGQFANEERLSSAVLRDLVHILPALEQNVQMIGKHLPSAAEVLIGRDDELTVLDHAWADTRKNIVVVRGKGGEGKTSLVATWMAELALKGWRGAEIVLIWSFYSQGTRTQTSATAEIFIHDMLEALGDPEASTGSFDERAGCLARLIGAKRCLLVLDGLEPLQHPPGPLHGMLKDPGMAALLRDLVANNAGLCVVTTREKVDEIKEHYGRCAIDHDLTELSPLAGAALLHRSGAKRAGAREIAADDSELEIASKEVKGHALTLFLIGQYLHLTQKGDIRRRDRMKLADAEKEYSNDATRPYGHAFKAIEAYEVWFASGDAQAQRQLAVLRLLGLFDRPATADCLLALRAEPAIPQLTEPLIGLRASDWSITLQRLADLKLLEVVPLATGEEDEETLDAHPLIREYFAKHLRGIGRKKWWQFWVRNKEGEGFKAAHSRLFDHLCARTEHQPDTLEGLQPLYQAVVHGCLAGRHPEARDKVYIDRILRGTGNDGYYSSRQLGAIGADLGAVAAFFEDPWSRLSANLSAAAQAWLLNEASTRLRALGRLTEAVEPMRVALDMGVAAENWKSAAIRASNLSELEVTLGQVEEAVADARRSIEFAERSGDESWRVVTLTTAADALHQSGEREEARRLFEQAEALQRERQPQFDLLYSLRGFQYCDLILAPAERAAWQRSADTPVRTLKTTGGGAAKDEEADKSVRAPLDALAEAERRAKQTLAWVTPKNWLLDIALDHLTLARAALYRALLEPIRPSSFDIRHATAALDGLRKAGALNHLPRALLTAALHTHLRGDAAAASRALAEAQQIAERGPMPLYLADVHLHRARLCGKLKGESGKLKSEWDGIDPKAELAKARALIEKHGYWRRKEELEDAEAAAAHWV